MLRSSDIARRWELTSLYPDDAAWEADLQRLASRLPELEAGRGRLAGGATAVRAVLDVLFDLAERAERLHTYASLRYDEDMRQPAPQGCLQRITAFYADLAAAASWLDPELLELEPERIRDYLAEEPGLSPYRRYFQQLERRRRHTLGAEAERLMGLTQLLRGKGATIAGLLRDVEIPWPAARLSDGRSVRLDPSGYVKERTAARKEDRVAVARAFYGKLGEFQSSLASSLHSTVQEHVFEARARHYDSALHAALSSNEIETDVYHTLVDEVGQALGSLHRQLSLRARALRCDVLEYDDLYAPLEDELASDYSWERTREIVLESVAPLGGPYVDQLRRALTERWVDVDPRPGKRSGAYVNDGAYSAHPFMLLNHVDDFTSLSTVAHESGHLMHSLLSQKNCPYPTAHYVIFVGEVASTLNEQLLFHYMLQRAEDEKRKLALIDHHLERLRRTVFRQAMFAEFELAIHRTVENGRALTADRLDESYLELLRRHHGTARQTMVIDEIYASEWASVPHFFMNFYVYQYATSCVAAMLLAQRILAGERGSLERYLNLLRSGSSEPPIELLCAAGVDMTSPEPIRAAVREMEDLMNRFSELLERRDESRTAQSSKSVGARPNASRTGA